MSEFKRVEVEFCAVSAALDQALPLDEAKRLKERLEVIGDAVIKFVRRRDEFDEVTSEEFLARLRGQRTRVDDAEQALLKARDAAAAAAAASASVAAAEEEEEEEEDEEEGEEGSMAELLRTTWQHEEAIFAEMEARRGEHVERRMRYGPRMRDRISALETSYDELVRSGRMGAVLAAAAEADAQQRAAEEKRREEEEHQSQLAHAASARAAEERARAVEEAASLEAAAKVEAEDALRRAAQEARVKRAEDDRATAEAQRAAEVASRAWPRGIEGVERALEALRASCCPPRADSGGGEDSSTPADDDPLVAAVAAMEARDHGAAGVPGSSSGSSGSSSAFSGAIAAVCGILSGIEKHPDDEKRRTVRIGNARFQEDLGRWDGGKECLLAAGFRLVHRTGESLDPTTGMPVVEPFLTLTEPDPFRAMAEWAAWMENIKVCTQAFRSHAEKVGAATEVVHLVDAPAWANKKY
jgi:hypothetical protein